MFLRAKGTTITCLSEIRKQLIFFDLRIALYR